MSNPSFIEITRGPLVECVHTGALALSRPSGELVMALGNVSRAIYPRSSIKAIQCLPLIETGAADHFGFDDQMIALACASHTGMEKHSQLAGKMLEQVGLKESALECGAHPPLGAGAARDLWRSGGTPSQLHNNCSGKHAGMLATALHMGEPRENYVSAMHPVQRRIHDVLCDLSGLPLGEDVLGHDGCSVPNWAMPLTTLAHVFALLFTGDVQSSVRRGAIKRIMSACFRHPDLIAGPGRLDTLVMSGVPGQVFLKTGAEGVYCGAFPKLKLGFALKVDDGATRGSAGAAMALIERLVPDAYGLSKRKLIKTWRGADVGEIRTAPDLQQALDGLHVPAAV